jgi:hypothetical protein
MGSIAILLLSLAIRHTSRAVNDVLHRNLGQLQIWAWEAQ